jgi:hypothetical protein
MDLWPLDITVVDARAPVVVLREQASFLGERTRNIVQADVLSISDSHGRSRHQGNFGYIFSIVAPALGNYRFSLFEAWHGVGFYPVRIVVDSDIAKEIPNTTADNEVNAQDKDLFAQDEEQPVAVAQNEEQLVKILGDIFRAKKTRQVIAAILSQSEAKTA